MEKLKLTDLDKFVLLHRANHCIWSRMSVCQDDMCSSAHFPFISALDCYDVQFRCGAFSKKNGARVEVIYKYRNCRVILLWHYVFVKHQDLYYEDYVFVPKAITIEREFKSSLLISIVPDPETDFIYTYQSTKSIHDLCVGDSVEGEDVADVRDSVCHAGVSVDTPLPNENKHSVTSQQ